jgi:hypothetical protein
MRFAVAGLVASPPAFSTARAKAEAIADRDHRHPVPLPLVGPHDMPVNIIGGYRFSGAPRIDFRQPSASSTPLTPEQAARVAASIDSDWSIPSFLDRRNSAHTSARGVLGDGAEKADALATNKSVRSVQSANQGV